MAAAARQALGIVREVRERRGIDTQSPINLVLSDGQSLVATRFVFDYGWYPQDDSFFAAEREHDYTTLYYATAISKECAQDQDARAGPTAHRARWSSPQSRLPQIAQAWTRAPEYSMLIAAPTTWRTLNRTSGARPMSALPAAATQPGPPSGTTIQGPKASSRCSATLGAQRTSILACPVPTTRATD